MAGETTSILIDMVKLGLAFGSACASIGIAIGVYIDSSFYAVKTINKMKAAK